MYTDSMKRIVNSFSPPPGFSVEIYDNEHFLVIKANEKEFIRLYDREKRLAAEYMIKLKKALEAEGAIVMLVRTGVEQ